MLPYYKMLNEMHKIEWYLGTNGCTFNQGQQITLHAFCAGILAVIVGTTNFINFVNYNNTVLLKITKIDNIPVQQHELPP